jgi:hypothetical protein
MKIGSEYIPTNELNIVDDEILVNTQTVGIGVIKALVESLKECDNPDSLIHFATKDTELKKLLDGKSTEDIIATLESLTANKEKSKIKQIGKDVDKITSELKTYLKDFEKSHKGYLKQLDFESIFPNFKKRLEIDDIEIVFVTWLKNEPYVDDKSQTYFMELFNGMEQIIEKGLLDNKYKQATKQKTNWRRKKIEVEEKGVFTKTIQGIVIKVTLADYDTDSVMLGSFRIAS